MKQKKKTTKSQKLGKPTILDIPELERLTLKQQKFAVNYAKTGNGLQSAKAAGYKGSENTLAVVANENLRKPNIKNISA